MKKYRFQISFLLSLGIILLGFFCLGLKLYRVQIIDGEFYRDKAKNIYTLTVTEVGQRGKITDRNGFILAGTQVYYDLFVDFRQINESHNYEYVRAALLEHPSMTIKKLDGYFFDESGKIRTRGERCVLYQLPLEECRKIEQHLSELITKAQKEQAQLPRRKIIRSKGLVKRESNRRFYPRSELLAPILGYVDYQGHGIDGIEKVFDAYLQPSGIVKKFERSARNEVLAEAFSEIGEKKDGCTIQLTIDSDMQEIAEEAITESLETLGPDAVIVLMADPKTGSILAAAQYPGYNPNDRSQLGSSRDLISQYQYEPGSMMKGITIACALDEGVITLGTKFDCDDNSGLRGMRDSHPIGVANVADIIKESSNIGSARACLEMPSSVFYERLKRFGIGEITGVGLPNEYRGSLRDVKSWSGPDHSRIAIGYAVSLTPLQLVQAYCAIANKGVMMKLRLYEAIRDGASNEIIYRNSPRAIRRVLSEKVSRQMCFALERVVSEGTGKQAAIKGVKVAGKTGTARKAGDGGYVTASGRFRYNGSFIGFLPADNPEVVILVTVDNAKKSRSYYGGTNAGPIFRKIAEKVMKYYHANSEPEE